MLDAKELRLARSQFYKCPFYWGKIDRKKAEAILEDQPNGSYLLKDPEDEDPDKEVYEVYEVNEEKMLVELAIKVESKYYYCRIRPSEYNGREYVHFSLYDYLQRRIKITVEPNSTTLAQVTMESLKKPSGYFSDFEHPILRNKPFSLRELARNEISNTGINDEDISKLKIPKLLQNFLKKH